MYKYYHYRFWCYQKAYKYFKKLNLAMNMTSTGLLVIGTIVGSITLNPAILASISRAGLVVKTYPETKDYNEKLRWANMLLQCIKRYYLISAQLYEEVNLRKMNLKRNESHWWHNSWFCSSDHTIWKTIQWDIHIPVKFILGHTRWIPSITFKMWYFRW